MDVIKAASTTKKLSTQHIPLQRATSAPASRASKAQTTCFVNLSDTRSYSAKRNARRRIGFPKSPNKWVSTVIDEIHHATPRKKTC